MSTELITNPEDTQDSRRKHHNTSDDDLEESSKRHKHRHHRHHRHHHHHSRRSHRKHDGEDIKHDGDDGDVERLGTDETSTPLSHPTPLPPMEGPLAPAVLGSNFIPSYDMEEGEILEDVPFFINMKSDFEDESGELKMGDVLNKYQNLSTGADDCTTFHESQEQPFVGKYKNSGILVGKHNGDDMAIDSCVDRKDINNFEGDKVDMNYQKKIARDDNNINYNNDNGLHANNEIGVPDHEEVVLLQPRGTDNSNINIIGDVAIEHCTSYIKSSGHEDRYHFHEICDSYGEDMEMDKNASKPKERGYGEWDTENCCRRDKDKDISRDRRRKDRERSIVRDRNKDIERTREREREKERYRDKEWEKERDRRRNLDMDRGRGSVRDRAGRHYNRESFDDHFNDREKYKNGIWYSRDDIENHRDRNRKNGCSKFYDNNDLSTDWNKEKLKRDEDEQDDYQEKVSLQLAEQEEEEVIKIKEESRRRMQAILEKYNAQQNLELDSQDAKHEKELKKEASHIASGNYDAHEIIDSGSDGADADVTEQSFDTRNLSRQSGRPAFETTSGAGGLGEGTPKSERSDNLFCDDIFGESPAGIRKSGKTDGMLDAKSGGLHDNWDDADGYYSYRFGEILDGRYEITAAHGKGVFSSVVRAKDLKAGNGELEELAIKIIRNIDVMHKAGLQELGILKKLTGADVDNRRHCVRFISHFKFRNHLCLVFESLHMNLREVLKKFGRNIGLKLTAVRSYSKQLFIALKHLKNCGILHCDIKPDNMLVNDAKNVLKLCDFGNAMFAGKNEITPYLVSRFYRAPEIILGLPYDHPLDIWSVGCCLYELYTGKVLFPGPSNNDMLRLHMELKGPFPKKMLRKGGFINQHFDSDLNFLATEEDPVTKKIIKRLVVNIKPKDIGTIIAGSSGEDPKMLFNFKDLLDKIFVLDPEKRMTVSQALNHPFITGK